MAIIDPPWTFKDKACGKELPYPTMTLDELKSLNEPIRRLLGSNSHIFLWCPGALLDQGMELLKAWGYKYLSTMIWEKLTLSGHIRSMRGGLVRNATEFVLVGRKGYRWEPYDRSICNVMPFVRNGLLHSEKPPVLHEIVKKLFGDNETYAYELFARKHVKGWTCFGGELSQLSIEVEIFDYLKKRF